jgi:hypothetical protein
MTKARGDWRWLAETDWGWPDQPSGHPLARDFTLKKACKLPLNTGQTP